MTKLQELASQLTINTHPLAITRDEGGYMIHEILGPDLNPQDWRFHEAQDEDLTWGPLLLEDENGVLAMSLVRIEC